MHIMDPYDQEPLAPGLGAMDTTPLPAEIVPSFIPQNMSHSNPLLPQEPGIVFLPDQALPEFQANTATASIHVPMSEISMPVFLNAPMEAMDPPQILPSSSFMPELRTVVDPFALGPAPEKLDLSPAARTHSLSPPQSQVPSPGIHGSSSSYGAGVTSSLESALDSNVVPGTRSRANTSISPSSIPSPFSSLSPPGAAVEYPPSLGSSSMLEESVSQQQPHTLIGKMLKDIAITAIDAGDAFENCHGAEQTTKVGELRDRIVQVLDMLSFMSLDNDAPPMPPIHPAILAIVPEQPIPLLPPTVPTMEPPPITDSLHVSVSDQSRKRCASALDEHRSVKALKREPQDDAPLSLSIQDAPIAPTAMIYVGVPPPPVAPYPVMAPTPAVAPPSQPPSRPPTPPSAFAANNSFGVIKQQTPVAPAFPTFAPAVSAPLLPHSSASMPLPAAPAAPPTFHHSPWSDPGPILPATRHHHSLSAGSINGPLNILPTSSSTSAFPPPVMQNTLAQPPHSVPSNVTPLTISHPIGRMSRSGSISGINFRNSYATFPFMDPYSEPATASWHAAKTSNSTTRAGQSSWRMDSEPVHHSRKFSIAGHSSAPSTTQNSPSDDSDEDDDSDSDDSVSGKTVIHHSSDRHSTAGESLADMPSDMDKIFFGFLNKLCSSLDAVDPSGEQIHQTLMAKKMQRLDESPDFRPFKFRIQAFTNSFVEELARHGYPEEKLPVKKVRHYLWHQQYILRFNEEGKKAKSKGNHTWNVEARKAGEGQWEFRPFRPKLAGTPPSVAYRGLRWSWKPHVWHPQCALHKFPVAFSSPSLPLWLSWKNGELSGVPPPEAESCQITAIAKFSFHNQDDQVEHTFNITVAPVSATDTPPYSRSRRTSLVSEEPPKRSTSDSVLFQAPQRVNPRINRMDDTRVIRVLQSIAQRVTDEAQSQFVSSAPPQQGELQDLVKQKHVLEQTVDAYDKAISGQGHMDSRRLAVAAQHVVLQAAQTVMADRTVANGGVPTPQTETVAFQSVSVSELTDKTQDAIAMAVKMNGTASNEVDIIVTATSILKSQTPMMDTPPTVLPPPSRTQASIVAVPSRLASTFPPSNLSPLPEYT
ncbi:hypothetical protein BDZ97DRAFT_1792955 [Flammula alnicola]|nr:hypothetical protein BDZ97DRAFT_1792955 [Flammula alnicola]